MKALLCTAFGPPDTLTLEDLPDPVPGPGEVVVDVAAAALNFFDTLIIENKYQYKPSLPFSPSAECAGTVAALGAGVTGVQVGQRVAAYTGWGAARGKVVTTPDRLVPVPDGLSLEKASGVTVTYGTTIHALIDRAELKAGETLVVLGASGGVGLAAIEIGKALGARVIACASAPDKLAFARERGADEIIDYAANDLRAELKRLAPGGVDVVYDPVGAQYAEPAVRALAWKGRYLVIGFAAGEIPKIPLNLLLLKGADIRGVFWGAFTEKEPVRHRAHMATLMRWAAEGTISAHIHAVRPLAEAPQALADIAARKVMGKVVLVP